MAATHVEVERKYVLPDGVDLPDLTRVPDVATVEHRNDNLDAAYYDTKDLALLHSRVTLRRRTGGTDAGWHLKTPHTDDESARTEFGVPLQDDMPAELVGNVRGLTRGRSLIEVAHIATKRSALVLRDSAGHPLAEVAVDDVSTHDNLRGIQTAWVEVEVELVDGQPRVLDEIDELLRSEGARRPTHVSKLAHALGRDDAKREITDGQRTAADALRAYMCGQLDALLAADLRLRTAPDDDAIHDLRVAARRMRSCLAAYRSLFATDTTKLRADIRWIGVMLGRERDDQVLLARLDSEFEHEPAEVPATEARACLDAWLDNEIRAAHEDSEQTLMSPRYLRTLDRLARLMDADGFTDLADAPAAEVLIPIAQRNWKRVHLRHSKWQHATGNHDEALHDVRKAVKRARYAFELLDAPGIDVSARKVRRTVDDLADLQDLLGLHHDMVVTRQVLVRLASQADAPRDIGFTFGRLHKKSELDAAGALTQFVEQWPNTNRHAKAIKPR